MRKIFSFTNIAPHYRASLWKKLLGDEKNEFHLFYGSNSPLGIQSIDFNSPDFLKFHEKLVEIGNIWGKKRILLWQKGVILRCATDEFDMAIFLGEMSCLSTWLAAIICRIRKIKVVFWGHGLYGNENKLKFSIRKIFYRLSNYHLLYERRAKKIMTEKGFHPDKLYVFFNSLNYDKHKLLRLEFKELHKSEVFPFLSDSSLPVIIFIGRLTAAKKLDMLLTAINQINTDSPHLNLVFIGDGSERTSLEISGKVGVEKGWLHFTGACYNEETIGRFLSKADLCVSPGNVGLTAIHSLSFGTPVCTHDNMKNQMPEAEAISEGYNGFFFKENDKDDLKMKIKRWLKTNPDREMVRNRCFEIIDNYYNPYFQLSVFSRLVNNEKPEI